MVLNVEIDGEQFVVYQYFYAELVQGEEIKLLQLDYNGGEENLPPRPNNSIYPQLLLAGDFHMK